MSRLERFWKSHHIFDQSLLSPLLSSLPPISPDLTLRVMTYNILAQNLLLRHQYLYKYSSPSALIWENRIQLILNQIDVQNPDLLCLQEVRWPDLLNDFSSFFKKRDYAWCFHRKPPDTPVQHEDGLVLIYRKSKFTLLRWHPLDLNANEFLNRDNVAVMAHLKWRDSGHTIYVVTTHLLFSPRRETLRLGQLHYILTHLWQFMAPQVAPVVLCGDLNSSPGSLLHKFLLYGHSRMFQLHHPFHFKSIYPPHSSRATSAHSFATHHVDYIYLGYAKSTTWTPSIMGNPDRIMHLDILRLSPHGWRPLRYLELPKRKSLNACPNEHEGSDHLPLVADLFYDTNLHARGLPKAKKKRKRLDSNTHRDKKDTILTTSIASAKRRKINRT